jgi:hypothetical protein
MTIRHNTIHTRINSKNIIRNYLLCDSTEEEINSYYEYLQGNHKEIAWMEKANEKREPLLNIGCSQCIENINVFESGVCRCPNGHFGYSDILEKIEIIQLSEQI